MNEKDEENKVTDHAPKPEFDSETRSEKKKVSGLKGVIIGVVAVIGLGVGTGIYVNANEDTEELKVDSSSLVEKESSSEKEGSKEISSVEESVVSESEVSVIEEPVASDVNSGIDPTIDPDSSVSNDNSETDVAYAPTNQATLQAYLTDKAISLQENGLIAKISSDASGLTVSLNMDMDYPMGVAMYNTIETAKSTGNVSTWENLKSFYNDYSLECYELSATPYVFNVYDPYTSELIYSTSMGQSLVDNVSK
jgi:hypothetical protein